MRLFKFLFCIVFLFISCGSGPEKEPVKVNKNIDKELNVDQEGLYSFNSSKTKIIWNGFKTTCEGTFIYGCTSELGNTN